MFGLSQDWGDLGFDVKATTSTSRAADPDQRFASPVRLYRPESCGAHRCWFCHDVTCHLCRCSMFHFPASSAAHQLDAVTFNVDDSGRRVSPRLDYVNSVLTGLLTYLVKRLHSQLNASAHLIYGPWWFDHVSESLMLLHWLRIPERIQFKLAVLVHRVLHGNAPDYLGPFTPLSNVPSRSSLSSASHQISSRPFVALISMQGRSGVMFSSLENSLPVIRRRLKNDLLLYSYQEVHYLTGHYVKTVECLNVLNR